MTFALPVNVTGMVGWMAYSNSVTDGLFGALLMLMISGVMFITFLTIDDTKRAFVGASVINALLAIVFFLISMVNLWVLVVSLGLAFASVAYLVINNEYIQ